MYRLGSANSRNDNNSMCLTLTGGLCIHQFYLNVTDGAIYCYNIANV